MIPPLWRERRLGYERDRSTERMALEARRRKRQGVDARRRAVRRRRGAAALALLVLPAVGVWALALKPADRGTRRPAASTATAAASTGDGRLSEPAEVRGVRVPMAVAGQRARLREIVAAAEPRSGINTLVVDVKSEDGRVAFPVRSRVLPKATPARRYDPSAVVRAAHAAGLYAVARVVAFADPALARSRPDLAVRLRGGAGKPWRDADGAAWADPSNPDAWRYVLDVARAAAAAGFDEVELAGVRFPSVQGDRTAVYARPTAARTRVVAEFLRQAVSELRPLGVRVSVEVQGMAASKDLGVGQDPVLIKQIVDVISPTLYPSGFAAWDFGIGDPGRNPHDTVLAALIQWRSILVNGQAELRPLLQAYSTPAGAYGKTEIDAQIRAAHEAGANGYVLSNPDGKY